VKPIRKLSILIIDDHLMVRQGLKNILESLDIMYNINVYEADNLKTALQKLRLHIIDLVFLDYNLENTTGAEILPVLLGFKKNLKVVALSNYDELLYVNLMLKNGALGYMIKNISKQQLTDCILMVMNNQKFFSSEILIKMLKNEDDNKTLLKQIKTNLSPREIQVLQMISLEFTNTEISKKLYLSKRTIDNHRQNLLIKLKVKNTVGLIKYALSHKLI
jgi:DNA-binding NarL/FixJ family response regulator